MYIPNLLAIFLLNDCHQVLVDVHIGNRASPKTYLHSTRLDAQAACWAWG